jgi:NAD-dependent dihydropyrimidine dehydrogenase PreA subunit
MIIDQEICIDCESCIPYCPVEAITLSDDRVDIDQDLCVECGVCLRSAVCPVEAFVEPDLEWPRTLRAKRGEVGFGIEMGRPGTGTTFRQVQQLTATLATIGVEFEKKNPLTTLLSDPVSGNIREDILDERVLTAIIEFKVPIERVGEVLATLEKAQKTLDTVFSLDYIHRPNTDGSLPAVEAVRQLGYRLSDHVKICTGLGRPKID